MARFEIFYPTLESPDCESKHSSYALPMTVPPPFGTPIPNLDACFDNEVFHLSSPFCGVRDAVAAPGPFPLIVHHHGGGVAGADFHRGFNIVRGEIMASHGFVYAVALHSGNAVHRVLDFSRAIDVMLNPNAASHTPNDALDGGLPQSIDADRIGISGVSAGGQNALRVAAGWSDNGIPADSRVKAMVLYEPAPIPLNDAANISFPYLIMGGTHFVSGLVTVPTLFNATVSAVPRIYVKNPGAVHFGYDAGVCPYIEQAREFALSENQLQTEPLTNLITLPAGNRVCNPAMSPAAFQSCLFWNFGEFQFPILGVGFGGGQMFDSLPTVTLAELKKGDGVMVTATPNADASSVTAVTVVSGDADFLRRMQQRGGEGRQRGMSPGLPGDVIGGGTGGSREPPR